MAAPSVVAARPRAVVLDLDDVLVPFHVPSLWQWAWRPQGPIANERRMAGALRRSVRLWDQRRWHGLTGAEPPADLAALESHLTSTLAAIAGHAPPPEEGGAVARRLLHPTGEIGRFPEVRAVVDRLRSSGTKVGVATPFPRESAEWWLKRSGLSDLPVVVAGDPPGPTLPSREAFRAAAQGLGIDPESVVMVGDLLWSDVRAARRAGLSAVLLERSPSGEPLGPGRIRSLDDLEGALAGPLAPPPGSESEAP